MRTIGFINWKGGVGKTTLAVNSAYYLAQQNVRVLFVDLDKQCNSSYWLGADPSKGTVSNLFMYGIEPADGANLPNIPRLTVKQVIQRTRYENIDIIAGDVSLLALNIAMLNSSRQQTNILLDAITPVTDNYDICIIDNPPDSNLPVLNGLFFSDDLIVVTLPNRFSLQGVDELAAELEAYNKLPGFNATVRGVVVNQFVSTIDCYAMVDELRDKGYKILPHIRGSKATQLLLNRSVNTQESVFEISPNSAFSRDVKKFWLNVLKDA